MLTLTYLGRFTVMAIGDIVGPKWLLIFAWVLSGLGCISIAYATVDSAMLAWGYAALYGVGYGMWIPLGPAVRGWLFGRASFGTISGIVATISMIGAIVAPTFAGYIYDVSKTYQLAYLAFGGAYVAAAVIFVFARRAARKPVPSMSPSAA